MIIINIILFLLGASLASFLNATLYRLDNGYKYPEIIKLGSHCEECKYRLKWWELIPILGYILIKGRCSSCKSVVNIYYPLSELFLGLIILLFFLESIPFYYWIIVIILFALSYFDVIYKGIYRNLVHLFLIISLIFFLVFTFEYTNIVLPLTFTILMLLLNLVKKSFGLGDILILLGLGILIDPYQYLVMFWLGIFIALLYSLVLVIKQKVGIKGTKIPMIPFFSISFALSVLYGLEIYTYLLNLIGI